MKNSKYFFIFSFLFFLFACSEELDIFNHDNTVLPNLQNREAGPLLITGCPTATEIIEDLNYKNIIGRCSDSDPHSDYYQKVFQVGDTDDPDVKLVKNLKPDVYISDLKLKNHLDKKFFDCDIVLNYFDFSTYKNCLESITEIGNITNKKESAEQIIQTIEAKALETKREIYNKKKPKVVFLLFEKDNIYMGTEASFVGSLLEILNANITYDINTSGDQYLPLNSKKILNFNPDIIVYLNGHGLEKNLPRLNKIKKDLSEITAVKNNCFFELDEKLYYNIAGFRLIHSIDDLKTIIYQN